MEKAHINSKKAPACKNADRRRGIIKSIYMIFTVHTHAQNTPMEDMSVFLTVKY